MQKLLEKIVLCDPCKDLMGEDCGCIVFVVICLLGPGSGHTNTTLAAIYLAVLLWAQLISSHQPRWQIVFVCEADLESLMLCVH